MTREAAASTSRFFRGRWPAFSLDPFSNFPHFTFFCMASFPVWFFLLRCFFHQEVATTDVNTSALMRHQSRNRIPLFSTRRKEEKIWIGREREKNKSWFMEKVKKSKGKRGSFVKSLTAKSLWARWRLLVFSLRHDFTMSWSRYRGKSLLF